MHIQSGGHQDAKLKTTTARVNHTIASASDPVVDLGLASHVELADASIFDATFDVPRAPQQHVDADANFYQLAGVFYDRNTHQPVMFSAGNAASYAEHCHDNQRTFLQAIKTWGLLDSANVGQDFLDRMQVTLEGLAAAETHEAADSVAPREHLNHGVLTLLNNY